MESDTFFISQDKAAIEDYMQIEDVLFLIDWNLSKRIVNSLGDADLV